MSVSVKAIVVALSITLPSLSALAQPADTKQPPPEPPPAGGDRIPPPPPPQAAVMAKQQSRPPKACVEWSPSTPWACNPPRRFALSMTMVKEYGFGGAVRVRFNHFGFEAAFGYQPVLVITMGAQSSVRVLSTYQATGALLIFFNNHRQRTQHGVKLGYVFNGLLQSGVLVGYMAEIARWKSFAMSITAGAQIYPQAINQLKRHGLPADDSAFLQPYVGYNLHFYLF